MNNNNCNNNNGNNFSSNEKQFKLQIDKNLKWDEGELFIKKVQNNNSSANPPPKINPNNNSTNNINNNVKELSDPFPVNKISLLEMKNFDMNLSEELLIEYKKKENYNELDPTEDDEMYSLNYSPFNDSYCGGCNKLLLL